MDTGTARSTDEPYLCRPRRPRLLVVISRGLVWELVLQMTNAIANLRIRMRMEEVTKILRTISRDREGCVRREDSFPRRDQPS